MSEEYTIIAARGNEDRIEIHKDCDSRYDFIGLDCRDSANLHYSKHGGITFSSGKYSQKFTGDLEHLDYIVKWMKNDEIGTIISSLQSAGFEILLNTMTR